MTYVPRGNYLTPEEYRRKIGFLSVKPIINAIKSKRCRLPGAIKFGRTFLIPENAVMEMRKNYVRDMIQKYLKEGDEDD